MYTVLTQAFICICVYTHTYVDVVTRASMEGSDGSSPVFVERVFGMLTVIADGCDCRVLVADNESPEMIGYLRKSFFSGCRPGVFRFLVRDQN